jgi:hypothetical protein
MLINRACGGTLSYETMAGAFRVHKDGVYRYRCAECKHEGTNNGDPRTCDRRVIKSEPDALPE